MKKIVAILVLCPLALCAADFTYYAAPNGADDADCLGPTTAGSFSNAMSKVTAASGNVELIFADGDYDCMSFTHGKGRSDDSYSKNTEFCFKPSKSSCSYKFRSASGKPEDCRLIGGGDEKAAHGFLYLYQTKQVVNFEGLQFTNFCACGAVMYSNYANSYHAHEVSYSNCVFRANGKSDAYYGGCFRYKLGGFLRVMDCTFENNVAQFGAVVSGDVSGARFITCDFTGNRALRSASSNQTGAGGVISGSGYFTNCTFTANACTGSHENGGCGGAIYAKNGSVTCEDCTFSANANSLNSVARGNKDGAQYVVFRRCRFENGSGTLFRLVTCENCYFTTNTTIGQSCIYKNSLFFENRITSGQSPFIWGNSKVYNCTFISNYTHNVSGKDEWHNSVVGAGAGGVGNKCYDSVFLDNDGKYGLSGSDGSTSNGTNEFYNCVYNGSSNKGTKMDGCTYAAGGVSAMKFQTVGAHRFVPSRKSKQLLDKGENYGGFTASNIDLSGNPRVFGAAIDIGCYENQECAPGLLLLVR